MNLITHIQDLVRGTDIARTKCFLDKSDKWTTEELNAYSLQKLQKLIKFSYERVPYYTQLMDSVQVKPADIKCLSDVEKIPVSTKDMIRKNLKLLIADNVNITDRKIRAGKTAGTTGAYLRLYKNTQTRDFTWGAYKRWYDWMGVKSSDKIAVLWGDAAVLSENKYKKIKKGILSKLSRTLSISSYSLNNETMPETVNSLIEFKPVLLRGYLSSILQIARYFDENNLTLPSLKAISSTTETLLPLYREYIENVFGVKMYDQYGCGECGSMAFECPAHEGLHITEEHCLVEILDEKNQNIYDKTGRVILTDLDNYAMPFIRYENGDSAVKSAKKCSCGRASELLTSISGRTKDVIYLKNGSSVPGGFFARIFNELGFDNFEYFTRFQIYQKVKGDYVCRLEKTEKQIPKSLMLQTQNTLLRFGNNVSIELHDKLKNDRSGKFRYVISDIED